MSNKTPIRNLMKNERDEGNLKHKIYDDLKGGM